MSDNFQDIVEEPPILRLIRNWDELIREAKELKERGGRFSPPSRNVERSHAKGHSVRARKHSGKIPVTEGQDSRKSKKVRR